MSDPKLHPFASDVKEIVLPEQFNNPFHYSPHPLCLIAAKELQDELQATMEYRSLMQEGKMFGVLVVQSLSGELGYLAAFSGNLGGSNELPFFVPPVYDLLHKEGYFRKEEEQISEINRQITLLEQAEEYLLLQHKIEQQSQQIAKEIGAAKAQLKRNKAAREAQRTIGVAAERQAELIKESQYEKAQLKRLERQRAQEISELHSQLQHRVSQIDALKSERKERSAALQQWLFEQFELLNGNGERKNLVELFRHTAQQTPPAGAGECAAPKLLQYAYLHRMKPIAMAEFWWGASPGMEVRKAGHFYPACKGKCEPILLHMLQGIEVEPNALATQTSTGLSLSTVFEDEYLMVVNKPAGLLSVPGKLSADSVWHRISQLHPEYDGPLVVHRLDMATSGLLLIAKTKTIHKHLQQQFRNRSVKKRYIALLDGILKEEEGIIDLPLCLDPLDRPRQMVHFELGKRALTCWRLLERREGHTLVAFYPETGRTHQLRVHAAHHLGLHAPIVGDELYGKRAERLYLHAERLEFVHPITKKVVVVEVEVGF